MSSDVAGMSHRRTSFPLNWVTTGRHLLLVGGGEAGANRLDTAVQFDWHQITMVAPDPTPACHTWAANDARVTLHERRVEEHDLDTVDLVIESTLDHDLGRQLAGWCRARKIPLNAMDKLEYCDIYYTAMILRGPLMLSISSSGEAPALASRLRQLLEQRIGPGWCNGAMLLAEARRKLPQNPGRMRLMKKIVADDAFQACVAANDIEGMKRHIENAVAGLSN
jgi:precorrin-2 dehydrogenase / sirohydrochlorin ferrochelatase